MGVLLVAPFILSLYPMPASGAYPAKPARSWRTLILIGLVTFVLFQNGLDLEYLVLPLIMLTAWRFGLRGAAPAALVASGVAIWAAV